MIKEFNKSAGTNGVKGLIFVSDIDIISEENYTDPKIIARALQQEAIIIHESAGNNYTKANNSTNSTTNNTSDTLTSMAFVD